MTPDGRSRPDGNPGGSQYSVTRTSHVTSQFAPLNDKEWAEANSLDAIRDEAFRRGYVLGHIHGVMGEREVCLSRHADLLTQLDAARRFAELGGRAALEGPAGR